MSVPPDADATRAAHWQALARSRGAIWAFVLGGSVAVVLGAVSGHPVVALVAPLVWVIVVAGVLLALADRRAATDFYSALARSLGFRWVGDAEFFGLTPLLAGGDRRAWTEWMTGAVDGRPAGLGHYAYECAHRDSDGDRRWVPHAFTLGLLELPESAERFRGVFVRSRRGLLEKWDSDDWLSGAEKRRVHLESTAVEERYEVWAREEQDDVALRRLLAPTLLVWLAEHPLALGFELYAGTLAVFLEREHDDAGHFVALLDAARHVAGCVAAECGAR